MCSVTCHRSRNRRGSRFARLAPVLLALAALAGKPAPAAEIPGPWLSATAYAVPKETTSVGEGYFSIVEGRNRRLYIGTAHYPRGGYLVEFDPATGRMRVVVDPMKEIGSTATGFAAQGKIHTRNNVGASGRIYFATKQEYRYNGEKVEDYPGGYPMVYHPRTGRTRVYPIPVPHQGIISIMPDESRGVAYLSTCGDGQFPDNAHFLVLDLKTGRYRDLMHTTLNYAFIVLDHLGRAYHPVEGGMIARYDPRAGRLELLAQTIDGRPPTLASGLTARGVCLNWETSPDRKTLYATTSSGNALYAYDLTGTGSALAGRRLGPLVAGAGDRVGFGNLCVGPTGVVWAAVTVPAGDIQLHRLVRYRPGDPAPVDLGPVAIRNPDYTPLTDAAGKTLFCHEGIITLPDGTVTTKYVVQGVCQARDGAVYVLALRPYTVLKIMLPPEERR